MLVIYPVQSTFELFGQKIHFYSVCMFCAIAFSYFLAILFSEISKHTSREVVSDFSPFMIFVSVIGARLYYVFLSPEYYLNNPIAVFMIWQGGLSIHGAIIAAIICSVIYCKIRELSFFAYADVFALVAPLGQAIGRWGNYFNQEAFGAPLHTHNALISLYVDMRHRPYEYSDLSYYHPAFLYESILDLVLFVILLYIMRKTAFKSVDFPSGLTFFSYILLYSVIRAIIEPLRLDTVRYVCDVPFPLLVSIIGIIAGFIGINFVLKQIPMNK